MLRRSSHSRSRAHRGQLGFALLELIVAMAIMAIVGLLAWRGMDAMIRGREVIERRSNEDLTYVQLVRQFDRDCQEILRRDELNFSLGTTNSGVASNSVPTTATSNLNNLTSNTLPSIAAGSKNIWWLRHYHADMQDAWLLVGYGMSPTGLQRWTSQPLLRRSDALALWNNALRNPDLLSSDLLVSWQAPNIVRQSFVIQNSLLSGAGGSGISATGTGTPIANSNTNNAASSPTIGVITPDQQGLVMQWWLKDIALPITRSCLMGGAL
ncbi:prepilin-type N-terminal cleavage/methylation domain-containing protein [Polynucleobacter paneuropaeus]|nr:prepilin-type N-terminal cleavage/methylation domain-containing protein [Polynucleobacter paneuropaeus]